MAGQYIRFAAFYLGSSLHAHFIYFSINGEASIMKPMLLINVSGEDRPGITSAVTGVLAKYDVVILDVGQSVIHDHLSLGILVGLPETGGVLEPLQAELLALDEPGLRIKFEPVSELEYAEWVSHQGKPRHIVTLLARCIDAEQIARVTAVTAEQGLNIDRISRLSGRIPLDRLNQTGKACIELSVRGTGRDIVQYRKGLLELAAEMNVDIAYQEDTVFRRHRRLVVFDMDSTLVEGEVIDELAKEAGVGDQVAAITARAMAGELDFQESFRQRVAMLKGLSVDALEAVHNRLTLTEGAEKLVSTLQSLGYNSAILSGGFTYFGERIRRQLGIDHVYANELDIEDGVVTGRVKGAIVDGQRKAELLEQLAHRYNISLEQTVAVGDGANDLPMLGIAGLGIAYRAKPLVRASAKQALSNIGLDGILYLMGIRDRDTL